MTPLPGPLSATPELVAWRLDPDRFAVTWDSGVGAESLGGRWNPKGFKAVYCSVDPSTCIIENAVHRGFDVLDTQPHVLTSFTIADLPGVRVVQPSEIPNAAWLHGGTPSEGQQNFGADLLSMHTFVFFPSAVSKLSWNVVFEPNIARGKYVLRSQERLALDTRLNPAAKTPGT
jgi:RES domain-containing protein